MVFNCYLFLIYRLRYLKLLSIFVILMWLFLALGALNILKSTLIINIINKCIKMFLSVIIPRSYLFKRFHVWGFICLYRFTDINICEILFDTSNIKITIQWFSALSKITKEYLFKNLFCIYYCFASFHISFDIRPVWKVILKIRKKSNGIISKFLEIYLCKIT